MPPYSHLNYADLETSFKKKRADLELYRNLTRYLDVAGVYSREQMRQDLLQIIKTNDLLIYALTQLVLIVQTLADPTGFLLFLKESVEVARRDPHPNLYLTTIPYTLTFVLDRDPEREDFFQFFVRSCEICHDYYTLHPSFTELNYREAAPQAKYLGPYVLYQYQRSGTVRSAWLEQRLQAALASNNLGFFDYLLKNEIPLVAIELHHPQVALELLGLFIKEALQQPELSTPVQAFLARLRIYYPDDVDDFMDRS